MTTSPAPERDWEGAARRRLESAIETRVKALRELADEIERQSAEGIADAITAKHDWHTYTRVASRIMHDLTWAIANLNLSNVIDLAADADKARQERREQAQ